jgi:cytochrome c-type biogenesis protein CcmH
VLWVIFACLTAAVLLALLRPLYAEGVGSPERDLSNAQVYRDQLREIDSDRDRGLIGESEAEAARLEIQRRLLASDAKQAGQEAAPAGRPERWLTIAVGVGLPVLALGLYFTYGSPGLPDEPLLARLQQPVSTKNIPELIARVEERLRQNPKDGQGWDVIAPVYMGVHRYSDAADAYQNAMALLGKSAKRLSGYGEALALDNDGVVSDEARAALEESVKLDPTETKPRVLLALADEQSGNYDGAIKRWQGLADEMKGDPRWAKLVDQKIAEDEAKRDGKPVPGAVASGEAGPSQKDVAAAQNMTPADRQAMINTMVGRLAQRLDQNGDDIDGWLKLVRAYVVLNRKDDAQKALSKAKTQFTGNASALARLNALADELGLQS